MCLFLRVQKGQCVSCCFLWLPQLSPTYRVKRLTPKATLLVSFVYVNHEFFTMVRSLFVPVYSSLVCTTDMNDIFWGGEKKKKKLYGFTICSITSKTKWQTVSGHRTIESFRLQKTFKKVSMFCTDRHSSDTAFCSETKIITWQIKFFFFSRNMLQFSIKKRNRLHACDASLVL